MRFNKLSTFVTLLFIATMFELVSAARSAVAVGLTGLTTDNTLVFFDSSTPSSATTIAVTGAELTSPLLGIDYRPANGQLYGVANDRIFTINPLTGAATRVNTLTTPFAARNLSGVDFNPAADALRLTGANGQNLRIVGGGIGATNIDGPLAYATGDRNFSVNPTITASAYTNSFTGPPAVVSPRTTELYNIDSNLNILVLQSPPNDGTLNTVGALGVDFGPVGGFDIFSPSSGVNDAFAAFALNNSTTASLYSINLASGAATSLGQIGVGAGYNLTGLAATPVAAAVPEPSSLLGLAIFGVGTSLMLKRTKRQRSEIDDRG